jgi:hypothetical protein
LSIAKLVSAGTLIFDAMLFKAFHRDLSKIHMFDVSIIPFNSNNKVHMTNVIQRTRKYLVAAIEVWYNTGSIQRSDNLLSNHIRTKLLCDTNITTYNSLADNLTSADIQMFPVNILGTIPIRKLPASSVNKIMLSLAGNKSMKYLSLAATMTERDDLTEEKKVIWDSMLKLALHSTCWMDLHPSTRIPQSKVQHFHLCVCNLIMNCLTAESSVKFREALENIPSFKKDNAFVNQRWADPSYSWMNLSRLEPKTTFRHDLKGMDFDKPTLKMKSGVGYVLEDMKRVA